MAREKRKQQRISLAVPANLVVSNGARSGTFEYVTRDVSSAGVFLETNESLPVGTNVIVDIFLTVRSLLRIIGADTGARVRVGGTVIRTAEGGIAIQFSKGFRFHQTSEGRSGVR